jgi:hypothetical protein
MEHFITTMIENKIKENDKASLYSFKLKEVENAKMYIKFENQVNSEKTIRDLKVIFQVLFFLKNN